MKSGKFKEITDDMIGRDDRICNCASRVADMIVEGSGDKMAYGKVTNAPEKGRKSKSMKGSKKRKGRNTSDKGNVYLNT